MHNFKELQIWKKSMKLSKDIYNSLDDLPGNEKFGLSSQIKRSVVSIPSNIAEGSSRSSNKDFNRFLQISLGSAFELETQLILAYEFKFIDKRVSERLLADLTEIQKIINGFIKSILN